MGFIQRVVYSIPRYRSCSMEDEYPCKPYHHVIVHSCMPARRYEVLKPGGVETMCAFANAKAKLWTLDSEELLICLLWEWISVGHDSISHPSVDRRKHRDEFPRAWSMLRLGEGMTYCGPNCLMLKLASQCPMLTHSSSGLPSTMPATKPPAKASLDSLNFSNLFPRLNRRSLTRHHWYRLSPCHRSCEPGTL